MAHRMRRMLYWSLLSMPATGVTVDGREIPGSSARSNQLADVPRDEVMEEAVTRMMRDLGRLLESVDWWTLLPDPSLLMHQPGLVDPAAHVAVARSAAGDQALVYLPQGGSIQLNRDRLSPGMQYYWFNPRDGNRSSPRDMQPDAFTAPNDQDWVLVLRLPPATD
jgi:outer membrane protein TolC